MIRKIPACVVIISGLTASLAYGQKEAPVTEWVPDKELVASLAPAKTVEGYSIQLPKGFELQQGPATPQGLKMLAWAGGARKDGTKPSVMVMMLTPPPGQVPNMALEQLADKMLAAVKRRRTNWQQGETEKGIVNGTKFVRIRWTGTDQATKAAMEGFLYVAQEGNTILQLTSQDVASEAKKSLPLAEASVLTFKKK